MPAGKRLIDRRNIRTGHRIPAENYCDQPYVVVAPQGHWLATLTTGKGREGDQGQHIVSAISTDHGKTWGELVDIEPASGPEASWVVPLLTPGGRVYAFYTYNGDNVRTLRGKPVRADTIGWYAFKHSDDGGRTWSARRHRIPLPVAACDRGNDWQGAVQIFWGIDKPKIAHGAATFAFTRLGRYMLEQGEGWFLRSANILAEPDPAKIRWELLPDGDRGLRTPQFGSVQEEHNLVPLTQPGHLYCVYRTTTGYPCHATSTDGGHTWTAPVHMTYAPGSRRIKNNRACPKLWKTANGRYLFWFHNHSGRSFQQRNPAWVVGGEERGGRIHWSQPEILLYDDDPNVRMSYPDLIEQDGRYWVTETQKTVARVHEIDPTLLEGLWGQGTAKAVSREGLLLDLEEAGIRAGEAPLHRSLDLDAWGGLSLGLWLTLESLDPGQVVLDARDPQGKGFALTTTKAGALELLLCDGTATARWACDAGLLEAGRRHHIVAIADAGPRILMFLIDGILCDGGEARQFGWGRYPAPLASLPTSGTLRLAPALRGTLRRVRLFRRALRTSEAVAHFHAGP